MLKSMACVFALAFLLAGCGAGEPPAKAADPYDPSKMDFKPPPAKLSDPRRTNAIAIADRLEKRTGFSLGLLKIEARP